MKGRGEVIINLNAQQRKGKSRSTSRRLAKRGREREEKGAITLRIEYLDAKKEACDGW